MDALALGETLVAVALTPVVSIGMALAVVAGMLFLSKKIYRR